MKQVRPFLVVTVLLAIVLMFRGLGHFALWDDEAVAALIAQRVFDTGDTSAEFDHNIVAYRNGLLIKNTAGGLKDRSSPPLQFYLIAPFAGLFPKSALAVRLPMASIGVGCFVVMLVALLQSRADVGTWIIFVIAMAGNVSLYLYFRQCRYYAPTILLTVAVLYTYLTARVRRDMVIHSILWVLLFATHYLTWAAVGGIVAIDYLFWGRKRRKLLLTEWAIVLLPQMIIGGLILWIWNPHSIDAGDMRGPWLHDRLTLLWWSIRDMNICEYGSGLLLLLAPIVGLWKKSQWLIRGWIALVVGVLVIVILSPQSTTFPGTTQADVRYLCGLIPLCIAVETMTLRAIVGRRWLMIGVPAAIVFFCTNLAQGGFLLRTTPHPPLRSTIVSFACELLHPSADPYTLTSDWINKHVQEDESILVLPDFATYPLMFHAPKAVYAWQLRDDQQGPGFDQLPPIDFQNRVPPDYIIGFAQSLPPVQDLHLANISYKCVAVLDVLGFASYRPELFWHTFGPPPPFDPSVYGVKIYQRQ